MPRLITNDPNEQAPSSGRLLGRQRPLHDLLGGGRVANIVLWRNRRLSAGILAGATLIWILFEVVEYHFLALLCHLSIIGMIVLCIWSYGAPLLGRAPPKIPDVDSFERAFKEAALAFHAKLHRFMPTLHAIACGKDLKLFLLAIASLWIISVIGSYCSSLSLLYFAFLCIHTLPALYEQYEGQVEQFVRDLLKKYTESGSKVLDKIPRGPVKDKKF